MPLDLHAAAALTPGVCTPQMYIGFGKSATCKLVDVVNGVHEFELMDLMGSILDAKPPHIPMGNDDPPLPAVARALQARNQRYTAKHGCAKADVNTNLWTVAPEACRTFPDATFLMIWRNVYEWAESQVTENLKSVDDGPLFVVDAPTYEPGSLMDKISRTWPAELAEPTPARSAEFLRGLTRTWCRYYAHVLPRLPCKLQNVSSVLDPTDEAKHVDAWDVEDHRLDLYHRPELLAAVGDTIEKDESCRRLPEALRLPIKPPANTNYWRRREVRTEDALGANWRACRSYCKGMWWKDLPKNQTVSVLC